MDYSKNMQLWGLDYARLTTILWGVCKNQEERIRASETATAKKSRVKQKQRLPVPPSISQNKKHNLVIMIIVINHAS